MPELIGEVAEQVANESLSFRYRGDEVVNSLDEIDMLPESQPHYADSFETYKPKRDAVTNWLISAGQIRVVYGDGHEEDLQSFEEVEAECSAVDQEYAETVTPRLQIRTGNEDHKVPTLDPRNVYAGYVALRAGGAVVLPTSVGMIVASASPRGLSTMYAVKERPIEKAGVVLTTMEQIVDLAVIPEGFEGYLQRMHDRGILVGSKLLRNEQHPLFQNQPEYSSDNSSQNDGTSMFVFLPGPYSDVTARTLAKDGHLLTASSANKSGQGNTRDMNFLHPDIKRGTDWAVWDPEAVSAYHLGPRESQGVMVDFRPRELEDGQEQFHVIRQGFMNADFMLESGAYFNEHPELGIKRASVDFWNVAHLDNSKKPQAA